MGELITSFWLVTNLTIVNYIYNFNVVFSDKLEQKYFIWVYSFDQYKFKKLI